jgi:hypothetical protein
MARISASSASVMRCAARQRFQPRHHLEGVEHVGLGEFDCDRAAVRQQFHQAFGGQHLDGLAQRRARDLQHL